MTIVLSLFALTLCPVALLASQGLVISVILTAILGGILVYRQNRELLLRLDRRIIIALVLFLSWCAVATIWSYETGSAFFRLARVTALVMAGLLLIHLPALLNPDARRRVLLWLTIGFGLTLALVAEEYLFEFPLFDALRGPADSDYASLSRLNRGLTALAMLSWPVAAALWQGPRPLLALLPMILLGCLLPFLESSAATVALVAGLISLAIALLHRKAGQLLISFALVVGVLASPVLLPLLKESGLAESQRLAATAQQRIEIWSATVDRIAANPAAGWGFDAARHTGQQPLSPQDSLDGNEAVNIPLHPHNASLQVFLELGAIGGLLFAALLWVIAAPLEQLPRPARLCGVGLFFTTLTIASLSYGIWQNQWVALIMATICCFRLIAVPAAEPGGRQPARAIHSQN